ncbi:MAG: hypothetical protein EBS42_11805, partial [Caulobacteraceae bacterium]|nr:hypothetical protein [Caulobacteraceae bacterium]
SPTVTAVGIGAPCQKLYSIRRLFGIGIGLVALISVGTQAQAQNPEARRIPLNYPGLNLHFTLPQGFCLATGAYGDLAKNAFGNAPDQLLLLAAFRCETMAAGQPPTEALSIKTARSTLNSDAGDRATFVNMGEFLDGGRDEFGQYTSVESSATMDGKTAYTVQSGGMTAINRRLIVLNYSKASLSKTTNRKTALEFIKAQTRSLIEENETPARK